jgi:bifunctional non-homologous end joining protein LigD
MTTLVPAGRTRGIYAFDMLAGDGEDHRRQTLSLRKANLDRLLSRQGRGHLHGP